LFKKEVRRACGGERKEAEKNVDEDIDKMYSM
jgi:hypothetical protein